MNIDLANLSLEEEDDEGFEFIVGAEGGTSRGVELCLIGKVLTDKIIHFTSFRDRMASLWRPGKGITISEVQKGIYVFQFYHLVDMKRVLDGGPWSFDNNLVVVQALKAGEDPCHMRMASTAFWIQVYDIPAGFITEGLGKQLGDFIGEYLDYDPNNNIGAWRSYMRIRVLVDITKPLKRKKKFRKQGGDCITVSFKYERLPLFCFVCGCLGHGDKFCPAIFDNPELGVEKGWGSWLRAPTRRGAASAGERWLVHPTDSTFSATEAANQGENQGAVIGEPNFRDLSLFQKNKSVVPDLRSSRKDRATILHATSATSGGVIPHAAAHVTTVENTSIILNDDRKRKKLMEGDSSVRETITQGDSSTLNSQRRSVEPVCQARRDQ